MYRAYTRNITLLEDALTLIERARNGREAHMAFDVVSRKLGFHGYAYLEWDADNVGKLVLNKELSTIDLRFVEGYEAAGFPVEDPVMEKASRVSEPFISMEAINETGKGLRHPVAELGLDVGFTGGLTIPVHGRTPAGARSFAVTRLAWKGPTMSLARQPCSERNLLQLAVTFAHESCIVARTGLEFDDDSALSPRERDCLALAALGSTSLETAEALRLAEATVNFHIGNAMRKLGVHSRTHAAAKAVALGLVSV